MRLLLLLFLAGGAQAGVADFRRELEAFAGGPVRFDPRIGVPNCAAFEFRWRDDSRRAIEASCREGGWRLVLPAGASAPQGRALALVRRGDPVQVEAAGHGYRLMLDGVAEGDGRPGERLVVRNLNTGRRMIAEMDDGGALRLAARNFAAAD